MLLRYVLPYIFLPSQLMGKPGRLDPLRDQFKKRYPGNFKESCVPSGNHTLDAFEWINPAGAGAGLDQQRWIVWLNANGVCFEELFYDDFIPEYSRLVGANILLWNY